MFETEFNFQIFDIFIILWSILGDHYKATLQNNHQSIKKTNLKKVLVRTGRLSERSRNARLVFPWHDKLPCQLFKHERNSYFNFTIRHLPLIFICTYPDDENFLLQIWKEDCGTVCSFWKWCLHRSPPTQATLTDKIILVTWVEDFSYLCGNRGSYLSSLLTSGDRYVNKSHAFPWFHRSSKQNPPGSRDNLELKTTWVLTGKTRLHLTIDIRLSVIKYSSPHVICVHS